LQFFDGDLVEMIHYEPKRSECTKF
jgi:hypothetical protein